MVEMQPDGVCDQCIIAETGGCLGGVSLRGLVAALALAHAAILAFVTARVCATGLALALGLAAGLAAGLTLALTLALILTFAPALAPALDFAPALDIANAIVCGHIHFCQVLACKPCQTTQKAYGDVQHVP